MEARYPSVVASSGGVASSGATGLCHQEVSFGHLSGEVQWQWQICQLLQYSEDSSLPDRGWLHFDEKKHEVEGLSHPALGEHGANLFWRG